MPLVMVGLLVAVAGAAAGSGDAAQTSSPPRLLTDSLVGADLYLAYCAACHGRDGKGEGPVAPALKTPPADLTTLARRAGGTYPLARVLSSIDGRAMPSPASHGTTEMPVWGPIFRQLDRNDTRAAVRLENIVRYVESLQVP